METKTTMIILIVIALIFIFGCIGYSHLFNQHEQVKIDDITFNLPEGYHETKSTNNSGINMSNGLNSMILSKCDEKNIQKNIKQYKDYKNSHNESIKITNFTANNILVYKSVIVNHTDTIHYWFNYKDNTYTVYTWDGNKNSDKFISELIESIQ